VRDILSGIYKGNEQALGDWGFEVDQSAPSGAQQSAGTDDKINLVKFRQGRRNKPCQLAP
jgi:hypothetical protein